MENISVPTEKGKTMENERCKNCEYFCEVRKHPTYQEVLTHICVYFVVEDQSDYILEAKENDMCECWKERKSTIKESEIDFDYEAEDGQ